MYECSNEAKFHPNFDCILQNSRYYSLEDHNKEFFLKS